MDDRDRDAFEDHLSALAATFRVEPTVPLKVGYWLGLRDLALGDVQEAIGKAIASSRFMPSPRDLRDLAGVLDVDQRGIMAWNAVKKAIREHGSYRSVDFDDPTINATVRSLGGWLRMCSMESEELDKFTAKDFQRQYKAIFNMGGPLPADMRRYLPGIFEASGDHTLAEPPAKVRTGLAEAAQPALRLLPSGER